MIATILHLFTTSYLLPMPCVFLHASHSQFPLCYYVSFIFSSRCVTTYLFPILVVLLRAIHFKFPLCYYIFIPDSRCVTTCYSFPIYDRCRRLHVKIDHKYLDNCHFTVPQLASIIYQYQTNFLVYGIKVLNYYTKHFRNVNDYTAFLPVPLHVPNKNLNVVQQTVTVVIQYFIKG